MPLSSVITTTIIVWDVIRNMLAYPVCSGGYVLALHMYVCVSIIWDGLELASIMSFDVIEIVTIDMPVCQVNRAKMLLKFRE